MIGIVDYGSGNVEAIATIYKNLNLRYKIISDPQELDEADKLILPGVGAFDATMQQMLRSGLKDKLDKLVLIEKKPVLGICVGMQILAESSEEGKFKGLGWIPGKVKKFDVSSFVHKPYLPHMGWNSVAPIQNNIFNGIDNTIGFYFVHSYYFECSDQEHVLGVSNYGGEFPSAVYRDNVYGVQFHPEKSHSNGVNLLKNFAAL
jgi:imidazole glycerol-phosphate synthase subunit HisH